MNNDSEMVEDYLLFDMPYIVSNAAMIVGILGAAVLHELGADPVRAGSGAADCHWLKPDLESPAALLGPLVGAAGRG